MRGFRFRLESVLAVRRHREELLQRQLADSKRALEAEKARLDASCRQMDRMVAQLSRQLGTGTLDMDTLCRGSAYLLALERQLESQKHRVAEQERQVLVDMDNLLQASRDKKSIERLKENLEAAFLREAARKEQRVADEVASSRYLMRQLAGSEEVG